MIVTGGDEGCDYRQQKQGKYASTSRCIDDDDEDDDEDDEHDENDDEDEEEEDDDDGDDNDDYDGNNDEYNVGDDSSSSRPAY